MNISDDLNWSNTETYIIGRAILDECYWEERAIRILDSHILADEMEDSIKLKFSYLGLGAQQLASYSLSKINFHEIAKNIMYKIGTVH